MASEAPAKPVDARHERQEVTGVVTSAKMEKTIIVKVTRLVQHKLYRRVIRVSKKFYAHDEQRYAKLGRHGAHRGNAPAVQAEALAPGGSRDAQHAGRLNVLETELREHVSRERDKGQLP